MTDDPTGEPGDEEPSTDDATGETADDQPPASGQSLVPPDAVRPLANAAVFVVVWTAMVVYLGRDPVFSLTLGLVAGTAYFLASYYLGS
jgi:hypothetical protein